MTTQEVRVTLTLEVDADQSKDDIIAFIKKAIDNRSRQHFIESKPRCNFIKIDKIEEESEIYDNE